MFYVYEHWRPDRDEPFYVGKGKGGRANMMARRNLHHKAIQRKLHGLGMSVEVRIIASGLSEREAFEVEIERIAMWRAAGIDLANKSDGGEGWSHKDGAKIKVSLARKGIPLSEEHRKKLSLAKIGKKQTSEHIRARSIKLIGNKWNKGKTLPEGTKQKIKQRMIGNDFAKGSSRSEKHRAAIALAHKGKIISEKTREKMKIAAREREERKRNAALFS